MTLTPAWLGRKVIGTACACAVFYLTAAYRASAIAVQLGEQDFTVGQGAGLDEFNALGSNEPAPFDLVRGSDLIPGDPFSATWSFTFAPDAYRAATITIGVTDHDSAASGDQVSSFLFGVHDLTSQLNAQFNTSGGRQIEYNIYSVALPAESLSSLSGGSAAFALTLKGPGLRGLSLTSDSEVRGNGAGLDFARLDLTVPEPNAAALCLWSVTAIRARGLTKRSSRKTGTGVNIQN